MVQDWPREGVRREPGSWQQVNPPPQGRRETLRDERAPDVPPLQVMEMLRTKCGIPAKAYFLAVVLDDGKEMTFATPRLTDSDIASFYDKTSFLSATRRASIGAGVGFDDADSGLHRDHPRRLYGSDHGVPGSDPRRGIDIESFHEDAKRKRPRHRPEVRTVDSNEPIRVSVAKIPLRIGNDQALWDFYEERFKNCQQTACKLIAKAWVKAVEPKKQSAHPYTGSDEKAPEWWPKPWGPSETERVRHKEPDHLLKKERVYLLIHILQLIVQPPHLQQAEVRRAGLNVDKLETVTNDALYGFFHDKEHTNNAKKEPFLREIFKVARHQERYKNGEIDGDTMVYVMATNQAAESLAADGDDIDMPADDVHEPSYQPLKPGTMTKIQRPPVQPHGIVNEEPGSANPLSGPPVMGPLPVRGPPYGHHTQPIGAGIVHGSGPFVESSGSLQSGSSTGIGMQELGNTPSALSRRSSAFPSPVDYGAGTHGGPPPPLYPPQPSQPWSNVPPPQSPSTLYGFSPQHSTSHNPFASQQSVGTLSQAHHHYVDSSMSGVSSSRGFDHPPVPEAGMYRGTNQAGATDPAAYSSYISPPPGRPVPGDPKTG